MHHLPGAIFGSKDHRNPHGDWGGILAFDNFDLHPLDMHDAGKLWSYVLLYDLEGNAFAISEPR
jgi:hypothetical protein